MDPDPGRRADAFCIGAKGAKNHLRARAIDKRIGGIGVNAGPAGRCFRSRLCWAIWV